MKTKFTIILFFIVTSTIIAQEQIKINPIDSLNSKIEIISLMQIQTNENFKLLQIQLKEADSLNKSLQKDLLFFKVKEDYYSTALSTQSTQFALIITGVLAIFGLVSFSLYKFELFRLKKFIEKKVKKQDKEFSKHIDKIKGLEENLNLALGNVNISIAVYYEGEKNIIDAFKFFNIGAKYLLKWRISCINENKDSKEKYEVVITNLEKSESLLDKIIKDNNVKAKFKKSMVKTNKILNEFSSTDNDQLTNLIAEIRTKANNYIK